MNGLKIGVLFFQPDTLCLGEESFVLAKTCVFVVLSLPSPR